MSEAQAESRNPYKHLVQTTEWSAIDRAVHELAQNRDLVEATSHNYIVGYLCTALIETTACQNATRAAAQEPAENREIRQAVLRDLRDAVRVANPDRRDLVAELMAERRIEAPRD